MTRRQLLKTAAGCAASRVVLKGKSGEVTQLNLKDASALVRRKAVSPIELTQACLARIAKLNPALNAFITVTAEQALGEARDAESEIQKGKWRGPLHGVPVALKDLFDTAGVRTTAGSGVFKDRVPEQDAEVVRRLRAAGAVLLGKLNMHEFAYGATSVPSYFGAVHNPWKLDRIAGGSSGGSAAAVAAGLCFGALGSDTGGSVRQPSAYCGIAGLKPTYGRVSPRGVIPLSWSLDHVGPMCRTVGDVALLLQGIAGYDPQEITSVDAPVRDYTQALRAKISALRLGVPRKMFFEQIDPEITAAMDQAIEALRKLTEGVRDIELPPYRTLPVVAAEAWAYHAAYVTKTPELYQPSVRERVESGKKITTEAYIEGRRELDRLRRRVREVFVNVDLLITPTTPVSPATIAESANAEVPPPGGVGFSLRNTQPFDIFGLPAISVPCGFTSSGLPIGLQITGPHWGEPAVLALAHAYEQATEWHMRRPALAG